MMPPPGPPPYYPPPPPPAAYARPPGSPDGKAVGALVLGLMSIVGCGLLSGIPAIILGTLARQDAERTRTSGGGMAMVGIVTGSIGAVLSVVWVALIAGSILLRMPTVPGPSG